MDFKNECLEKYKSKDDDSYIHVKPLNKYVCVISKKISDKWTDIAVYDPIEKKFYETIHENNKIINPQDHYRNAHGLNRYWFPLKSTSNIVSENVSEKMILENN